MQAGSPKPPPAAAISSKNSAPSTKEAAAPAVSRMVTYRDYEEKTARLTADQLVQLKALARICEKDRKQGSESRRITDTTLIRVAVDLLLDKPQLVRGATEEEIISSLRRT